MLYETQNPHGGDVYGMEVRLDFSSNVNPLGPPPSVISAMQRACAQVRQYPDPYCRALTRAIAAHEGVPERSILCGAGAAELIYAYCDALRPKKIAELAPTFSEYSAAAAHFGAKIVRFSLHAPDFTPDETLFSFLESEKPDALFLCTPNNPTGKTIPRALLEAVLQQCKKQHTHVLLDECFLDFTDEKSAQDLLPQFENLLILKAFTKNFALAGARVGYCLTENHALLREMSQSCQPWNVSLAGAGGRRRCPAGMVLGFAGAENRARRADVSLAGASELSAFRSVRPRQIICCCAHRSGWTRRFCGAALPSAAAKITPDSVPAGTASRSGCTKKTKRCWKPCGA